MLDNLGACPHVRATVGQVAVKHGITKCFGPREALVDGGMTSLAMVDLLLAIEHQFDLLIPDPELTPDNFACIDSIARMIARVRGSCSYASPKAMEDILT